MLIGREVELEALASIVSGAREGKSGVLCVHGEAGAGKTALLRQAARDAGEGVLVLQARGVESEAHLAFAALADLVAPVVDLRGELPPAQAGAVSAALALEDAPVSSPFAVAAGVLSLLAAAAERRPAVVVVDDLQWVDEASRVALLFAARRLEVEAVAVMLGVRDGEGLDPRDLDVDILPLEGLDAGAACRMPSSGTPT